MKPVARCLLTAVMGVAAFLLVPGAGSRAEVGGAVASGDDSVPIYFGYITDDPDPINTVWTRFSPAGPGRAVLNEEGAARGDGRPSALVVPSPRTAIVAWARRGDSGFDIVLSRLEAGAWTEPEVLDGSPDDELDPSLVAGPDGSVHLFYWVDGPQPKVLHRQAPADLSSWSTATEVSDPAEPACRPAAVLHEGVLYVAYEVHRFGFGQSPREVALARREGDSFVPEIVAATNHGGDVRPQVHSHEGRLWVDWVDDGSEAAWTRRDAQGHWTPLRYVPFASAGELEFFVRGTIRYDAIHDP